MRFKKLLSAVAATAIAASAFAGMAVTASAADVVYAEWNAHTKDTQNYVINASGLSASPTLTFGSGTYVDYAVKYTDIRGNSVDSGSSTVRGKKVDNAAVPVLDTKLSSNTDYESVDIEYVYHDRGKSERSLAIKDGDDKPIQITDGTVEGNPSLHVCVATHVTSDTINFARNGEVGLMYIGIKYNPSTSTPSTDPSISISSSAGANISVNGTTNLTATITNKVEGYDSVEWTSDAESIATVDGNGTVTGKSAGEATITAKYVYGENENDYIESTYKITVTVVKSLQPVSEQKTWTVSDLDTNSDPYYTNDCMLKVDNGGATGSSSIMKIEDGYIKLNSNSNSIMLNPAVAGTVIITGRSNSGSSNHGLIVNDNTSNELYNNATCWTASEAPIRFRVYANTTVTIKRQGGVHIKQIEFVPDHEEYFSFEGTGNGAFTKIVVTSSEYEDKTAEITLASGGITLAENASFYLLITGVPVGVTLTTELQ